MKSSCAIRNFAPQWMDLAALWQFSVVLTGSKAPFTRYRFHLILDWPSTNTRYASYRSECVFK